MIYFTLILLFIISGAVFLISTSDLISVFLSIELQSYGLYLLSTIYRNSELSTTGGLMYFLLGGLSSTFILLGTSLLYANSGTTNLDALYAITSISDNIDIWYKPYYINFSLLIFSIGFLFKVSAAPFHFWSPEVYDAIPTIVTTFVAIIAKISIFVFLLEIVYYTKNYFIDFNWTYGLLISSLFSMIIGTIVGLTQFRIKRLFAYSTIVRRCALFIYVTLGHMHCSNMHPTSELGEGEIPTLNLASPPKRDIRLNQYSWLGFWVAFSKIKTKLFEVQLQGSSTIGNYLVWDRVARLIKILKWCILIWTDLFLGIINTYTAMNGQSKENYKDINNRTAGLPKAKNGYGNRGIVVPLTLLKMSSIGLKGPVAGGRIPGLWYCSYSSTAGDSSTVQSDVIRKLQWLEEKCKDNLNFIVSDIYSLMYNKNLYEIAYNKLKSKPGNMTPGIIPTTLDGFSSEVIQEIILNMKNGTFKFKPRRRVQIPKASGIGSRPLTVAPPRDKIVQEVMRMILELIYEPNFSPNSHGFRANKSCHSAIKQIFTTFGVATWYIEGDISKCFDSFDHNILIGIIRRRIKDERFIRLLIKALKAGYFEFKVFKHSIVGTPQGSIISPILCNIYMDGLDKFIEDLIRTFSKGSKPRGNPIWISYSNKKARAKSLVDKIKWHKLMLTVPSKDPLDPSFKKLVYVRYADDWILGVKGSKEECVEILDRIRIYLKEELKLNLSEEKTLITNANKEKALFLGTQIYRSRHQSFSRSLKFTKRLGREIRLMAPIERITKKLKEAGFLDKGVSVPRFLWMHNSKDQIIALYNSVYRGFMNYYSFAHNFGKISGHTHSILLSSCAKLLAAKLSSNSQKKIFGTFGKNLKGNDKIAFVEPIYKIKVWDFKTPDCAKDNGISKNGLITTLYADKISLASLDNLECAICESDYRVEMHHVRMLKDLNPKISKIDQLMAKRCRKQIPLCRKCHMEHHFPKSEISKSSS